MGVQWVALPATPFDTVMSCCLVELLDKARRTTCPKAAVAAAVNASSPSLLAPCVLLEFDRRALLAAAAEEQGRDPGAVDRLFWSHLVLSEGAPIPCRDPERRWCPLHNVEHLKDLALRGGILLRLHGPRLLLQGQEDLFALWSRTQPRQL